MKTSDATAGRAAHQSRFPFAHLFLLPLVLPIDLPSVQAPLMTNGIATDGAWLYVACAAVDQSANLLTALWPPLPQIEQTAVGSFLLYAALSFARRDRGSSAQG